MTNQTSRRAFLQRASMLSLAGVATPWALNLAAMGEAAAATAADYKALVCVFLYGGNDYGNTLVPYDNSRYALYQVMRPTLATAVQTMPAGTDTARRNRVNAALLLVLAAPEFIVQK